jgi:hypothetical protein
MGSSGTGVYLLTWYGEQASRTGQTFLKLTIEDASGRATAFAWPEARDAVTCAATPVPVIASGTVQRFEGFNQLRLQALRQATVEDVHAATALLPRRWCPDVALPALDRLAQLEAELPPPLDCFLRRVLLDPAIALPFLRCRASVSHHHAYVGGLLVHSTEMLEMAATLAGRTLPEDPWAAPLAQLGYLLHDLGKLTSVGESRRPRYPFVVAHEFATIELLTPHLRWLDTRDKRLTMALRYVLAYLATPARARGRAEYFIAELVAKLDQYSTAAHNRRDLAHLLGERRFIGTPGAAQA